MVAVPLRVELPVLDGVLFVPVLNGVLRGEVLLVPLLAAVLFLGALRFGAVEVLGLAADLAAGLGAGFGAGLGADLVPPTAMGNLLRKLRAEI